MKEFFKELFTYSHHYNEKLVDIFLTQPDKTSEKSVKLFNHILNAQHVWNHRINGFKPVCTIWGINPTEELAALEKSNYEGSLQIIDQFDLDQVIAYHTSAGQPFQNTIRELLFHVVNHSTYHRAQIATEFKNNGIEPLVSDYIFYKR